MKTVEEMRKMPQGLFPSVKIKPNLKAEQLLKEIQLCTRSACAGVVLPYPLPKFTAKDFERIRTKIINEKRKKEIELCTRSACAGVILPFPWRRAY